ncbi:hypothetical protein [Photorhabdus viridis]
MVCSLKSIRRLLGTCSRATMGFDGRRFVLDSLIFIPLLIFLHLQIQSGE